MSRAISILRRIIGVHGEIPLPAGIPGSPLDARAMELSTAAAETAFREHGGFEDIAGPFHRFFAPSGRARSDQALKKAFHVIVEERMRILALRADPPTRSGFGVDPDLPSGVHPLDEIAWAALGPAAGARPRGMGRARFKMLILTTMRAARLVARAVWIGLRYGRFAVERTETVLGIPAAMGIEGQGQWEPLESAARSAGLWREGAIAVVDELDNFDQPCAYPVIRLARLPAPFGAWGRQAVWPSFCLAAALVSRACVWAWRDPHRTQLAYEALMMAEQSLPMRRLCLNRRFRFYLDVEEYAPRHIVKAMVLDAAGGRLVRWAQGIVDGAGAVLSYLGYHDFLSFGPYHRRFFSATWLESQCNLEIGLVRNDRRLSGGEVVTAQYRKLVEEHKASGGRLMVYFLPSVITGRGAVIQRTLEILARLMARRQGWLLVVKPKGARSFLFARSYLTENKELFSNNGANAAVFVEYGDLKKEVCGAGWLLRHMDLGTGISSTPIEGLCLGKPVLQYYPFLKSTPFLDRSRAEDLAFDDPDAFEAALGRRMDNPECPVPLAEWAREHFQGAGDYNALGRAARHFFRPRENTSDAVF